MHWCNFGLDLKFPTRNRLSEGGWGRMWWGTPTGIGIANGSVTVTGTVTGSGAMREICTLPLPQKWKAFIFMGRRCRGRGSSSCRCICTKSDYISAGLSPLLGNCQHNYLLMRKMKPVGCWTPFQPPDSQNDMRAPWLTNPSPIVLLCLSGGKDICIFYCLSQILQRQSN